MTRALLTSGLFALTLSLGLVACSGNGQDAVPAEGQETIQPATPETSASSDAHPEDDVTKARANGFITENLPPPASAVVEDGDVPRDDYGRPYQYEMLGQTLPEFEILSAEGEVLTREDITGEWKIVEVWGIWCPDCVADGPNVQALSEKLADEEGISLLTVHTPPSPERQDEAFGKYGSVDAYFTAKGFDYPYAIDRDASFKSDLELPWVPSYLLVDPDGVIRGYRSELSAAGDGAVDAFIEDVKDVMSEG